MPSDVAYATVTWLLCDLLMVTVKTMSPTLSEARTSLTERVDASSSTTVTITLSADSPA